MIRPRLFLEALGLLIGVFVVWLVMSPLSIGYGCFDQHDVYQYRTDCDYIKGGGIFIALFLLILSLGSFTKRYIDMKVYFDQTARLIKEYYLIASHPRLLAGANRLSRDLILLYGPHGALERLPAALDNLVRRSSAQPVTPSPEKSRASGFLQMITQSLLASRHAER
jgi:hypothetical protein